MPAKHVTQYPLNNLRTEQFSILVLEASQALKWQLGAIKGGFSLTVPASTWSKGEMISLIMAPLHVDIESKTLQRQVFGGIKNEKNLKVLTAKLDEVRAKYTLQQLSAKYDVIAAEQENYNYTDDEEIDDIMDEEK